MKFFHQKYVLVLILPLTNPQKSLTIYDVPGHERIRYAAFEKIKNVTGGIVFLVDSATIQKDVRDAAE